jgi:hypothetical protein
MTLSKENKRKKKEDDKRAELLKKPRRCVICGITKDGKTFSKIYTHICNGCDEKR